MGVEKVPDIPGKIMRKVGTPDQACDFASLPNKGVGLARLEFIINRQIGIHPQALLELDKQPAELRRIIDPMIAPYGSPVDYFVKRLSEGEIVRASWRERVCQDG